MKDHEIAKIYNSLRDVAKKFANSQQLRERLIMVVKPLINENKLQTKTIYELDTLCDPTGLMQELVALRENLKLIEFVKEKETLKKENNHTNKRQKLSEIRYGLTKKATKCGMKYYVTVNFYEDNNPAEVFVRIAKEGSTIAGFIEALAITISIAWQYGVPWEVLYTKYLHQIFEPRDDENSSLVDAIGGTIDEIIKIQNEQLLKEK